uniref:NADP-dependent oxidoreductase domain-containing protein n=1 Tax=Castor canadensis TaxID=51338 RepID=A0A8C0WQP7_CASCN
MNSKHQCVQLNDGHFIPVLGFGTYTVKEVTTIIHQLAIDAGFHHIDSGYIYKNEEELGLIKRNKITDGTVKREDIFYTSKVIYLYVPLGCPTLIAGS